MSNIKAWIESFRLRTLPLALSCTGMGSILAAGFRLFNLKVFILTSVTAIFLQILSNLANDYGDTVKGTDNENRVGPQRALQSGHISLSAMRNAIIICALLALGSGCWLLNIAIASQNTWVYVTFLLLGLVCIAAAIRYTVGNKPYGYSGFGDIAVFLFFGIVGVCGSFYLHAHYVPFSVFLPASSLGLLSAGVLNINNMRDISNDAASNKKTLVVRMGLDTAKRYHVALIATAIIFMLLFIWVHSDSVWHWLFLIATPLFFIQVKSILKEESSGMDKYLKQLSLTTLLMVVCIAIGVAIQPFYV
ncbi:MAG TPA: 1,4-dihydroxy-2-naphthoate polyprenyltransferase [Bacteroidia bacterium]|nr:1,4-dihydroxy-2-naphthoate polyprenyltransferase [Bacteroidia bacterium]